MLYYYIVDAYIIILLMLYSLLSRLVKSQINAPQLQCDIIQYYLGENIVSPSI